MSLRVPRPRGFTLEELCAAGALTGDGVELLRAVVAARLAFLVSGGTGTGKTTLGFDSVTTQTRHMTSHRPPETKPRHVIGYARISDARGDVASLARQQEAIRETAARLGWHVDHILVEPDTSAWKRKRDEHGQFRTVRPQFQRALDLLRSKQADGFLAYDLDRVARDLRDLEDLIDVAAGLFTNRVRIPAESATGSLRLTNSSDEAMARVMVTMARKASDDTSRRVQAACETRARAGGNHGGRRRYGFTPDGMSLVPAEAAVLRDAADVIVAGGSLRSIVNRLNAEHVPTVAGGRWHSNTLRDMLLRPRNAGLATRDGVVVGTGQWEPLWDRDRHDTLVDVLNAPGRKTTTGNTPAHLGSGLYLCACGQPMRSSATSRGGVKSTAYRCWDPTLAGPDAQHSNREAAPTDALVAEAVCARLDDPALLDALRRARSGRSDDVAEIATLIETDERRAEALRESLTEADPDEIADLRAALRKVRDRIAERRATLAAATRPDPLLDALTPDVPIRDVWAGLRLDQQRALLDLLARVTILPARGGRPKGWKPGQSYVDPDQIRIDWL